MESVNPHAAQVVHLNPRGFEIVSSQSKILPDCGVHRLGAFQLSTRLAFRQLLPNVPSVTLGAVNLLIGGWPSTRDGVNRLHLKPLRFLLAYRPSLLHVLACTHRCELYSGTRDQSASNSQ